MAFSATAQPSASLIIWRVINWGASAVGTEGVGGVGVSGIIVGVADGGEGVFRVVVVVGIDDVSVTVGGELFMEPQAKVTNTKVIRANFVFIDNLILRKVKPQG